MSYLQDQFDADRMKPTCVQCGAPFDHGCNSAFCSQSCEDEAETIHERAHAGVRESCDPDDCDRGETCPGFVKG